ncbi:hypothetical protein [Glaciecola sp. 1036]|uniref:hypothetical protein n=1 Tax=Alteromonadaceae TaxID=72275 RepID=UPI003D03944E
MKTANGSAILYLITFILMGCHGHPPERTAVEGNLVSNNGDTLQPPLLVAHGDGDFSENAQLRLSISEDNKFIPSLDSVTL